MGLTDSNGHPDQVPSGRMRLLAREEIVHRINEAEICARMLELTILAAIAVGAISAFTLSVIGVFIISSLFVGILFLVPIEKPFSPLELVTVLAAMQVAYLASGLLTSFRRIRR